MKLVKLYGIAFGCPKVNTTLGSYEGKRGKGCPLSIIDTFTIVEKVHWIEKLNDEDVAEILEYHSNCFDKCF